MSGSDEKRREEAESVACESCGRELEGFLVSCPYCGVPAGDSSEAERERFEKEFRDTEK